MLEPSMGDGAFIIPAIMHLRSRGYDDEKIATSLQGVELFPEEVEKAKKSIANLGFNAERLNLLSTDFFKAVEQRKIQPGFDIVLGNPPFIRYQNFPIEQRDMAMLQLNNLGFKLNKLTNAWLFFLLRSITMMKAKSRLAMVIPAELLQVKYASSTRQFLSKHFSSVTVLTFKKLVFEGIQQEVVLILAEKDPEKRTSGIDAIELESIEELENYKHIAKKPGHLKPVDHLTDKWTQYFLTKDEILLLKSLENNPKLVRLGDLGSVDVGIVTGNNKYFVLDDTQVNSWGIKENTIPLVGRSASFKGITFNTDNWNECVDRGLPSHLLTLSKTQKLDLNLKAYIKYGENQAVNLGYKCRIRKEWYVVPSVRVSQAFLLRQVHEYPKFIVNDAGAACTDTIHRVTIFNSEHTKLMAASFINSLSFAIAEVVGRSYGGGVLELEPSEAEDILLPFNIQTAAQLDLKYIDSEIRSGNIRAALDYVDERLLVNYLGFSKHDSLRLRNIWEKLSLRRINRK